MIRLLIGGSQCTHWSIAQKKNREIEAKGMGWDLFKCYLKAKEIFKPDYFLYENVWSAAGVIKEQIAEELGQSLIHINSALVSAQNRDRFYVTNIPNVEQPKDKGIKFSDIAEKNIRGAIGEPFCIAQRGVYFETLNRYKKQDSPIVQRYEIRKDDKANALTTVTKDDLYCTKVKNNSKDYTFEVKNNKIEIRKENKVKCYEINLSDGKYKVRNLTTLERKRLQTVPDEYKMLGKSKDLQLLGNGWTVDVIAHILSYIPNIENEEVEVLSMFDGMCCGMLALEKVGAKVVRYRASEIEQYAIDTVKLNYPNVEQIGNAFDIEKALKEGNKDEKE